MRRWLDAVRRFATVLASLALATPALAADDRVAAALAARDGGDNARAIALLQAAVAEAPRDADTMRQLGVTLAYAHRYPEAIALLTRARALEPRDADIALALSRALLWSGDRPGARRVADETAAFAPGSPEIHELAAAIAAADRNAPRPALDLVETASRVSIGATHRTWYETAGTLAVPIGARTFAVGSVDVEDRVSATNTRLSLRADRRFGWGSAYLGATATPDATFRERWSVLTGGTATLSRHLFGSIEVRRAHYNGVDVTVVEPGLTLHAPDDRWAVAVHTINLWGESGRYHDGGSLRGDYTASRTIRVFGGVATYADTEAGITQRVDSGFAGVGVALARRLSLQLVADHEVRHASYRRDGITLGLHWRLGP